MPSSANSYNKLRLTKGILNADHISALTREFQRCKGLHVDGKLGPKTLKVLLGKQTHPLVSVAMSYIGHGEIGGASILNNAGEQVDYFRRNGTGKGVGGKGSWCAEFVSTCLKEAGANVEPSAGAKRLTRNVIKSGHEVVIPKPGDVICWHRGLGITWKGHVAIVVSYDQTEDKLVIIEGNRNNRRDRDGKYSVVDTRVLPKGKWRKRLYKIGRYEKVF